MTKCHTKNEISMIPEEFGFENISLIFSFSNSYFKIVFLMKHETRCVKNKNFHVYSIWVAIMEGRGKEYRLCCEKMSVKIC